MCGSDGVVLSWSLLIRRAQRARRQAEIPLIVLCRFPGPALYLKPGGFDFYYYLKEASYSATVGGEPFAQCLAALDEIGPDVQRKYNILAVKALGKWIDKAKPTEFFAPPVGSVVTPGNYVRVKLEPDFGAVVNGNRRLVQVWYSKSTSLTKNAVTLGTYFIKKHLCVGEFTDSQPGILDLGKKELVTVEGSELVMDLMVSSEFAWIDNFFKTHEAATKAA